MKPAKPTKLPPDLSLADLCWLLGGLTRARVAQLVGEGVIERVERGRYSVASVPRFIQAQRKAGAGPKDWNKARTELVRERVLAARAARLRAEGESLPTVAVRAILSGNNLIVRDNFLGLGTRLAPRVFQAKSVPAVKLLLDAAIREVLETVSETSEPETMRRIKQAAARLDRRDIREVDDDGQTPA
jgi:hypothetical protein